MEDSLLLLVWNMLLEEDSGVIFEVRILDTGLYFLRALLLVEVVLDVTFVVDVGNDLKGVFL